MKLTAVFAVVCTVLVALLCREGLAESEMNLQQALAISGTITSGKVYQLQVTGQLGSTNEWLDADTPHVAAIGGTQTWYYGPDLPTSLVFRITERASEPEDYVAPFLSPFYGVLSDTGTAALLYFETSMLANATFVFNPLTEVKGFNVTYTSTDAHGYTQQVSGLLVTPTPKSYYGSLPMMSIQHPTQVERMGSPSFMCIRDDEISWIIAYLVASTGYIVVMPDYPGMGVNQDVHPYCHPSLSFSAADLIYAATNLIPYKTTNIVWNSELYLMGYSEGGYATMVTARDLQIKHTNLNLKATACLDGPYSLSKTMLDVILNAGTSYADPYFLPYTIEGYGFVYSNDFSYYRCVTNSIPGDPNFAENLQRLMNGNYTGEDINDFMTEVPGYTGPRSILTSVCLNDMENPNSLVRLTLASNDAFRAWIPDTPLRMYHNVLDDLVPFGNATNALAGFISQGADTNLVELKEYILFIPGMGTIHAGSFPVAMLKGYLWLDSIAYPARH